MTGVSVGGGRDVGVGGCVGVGPERGVSVGTGVTVFNTGETVGTTVAVDAGVVGVVSVGES